VYGLDVREAPFKLEWMPDPWSDVVAAARWLRELDAEVEPSLIHLNHFCHAGIGWSAPTLVAAHSCVLSWWDAVKGQRAPADWERYRQEVQTALRGANLIVTSTTAGRQSLDQYYGAARNVRVIPNGRDGRWFVPAAKQPFILSTGPLGDEARNLRALDDVAGVLPWPVYVAGAEGDAHAARGAESDMDRGPKSDVFDGTGVSHVTPGTHCHPLGPLDMEGRRDWLSRAAIYTLPAKYEPFGSSVLDAGLSGCALVLGDIPSLREIWQDAAIFVPPDDRVALAEALSDLIASPDRRRQLAYAARGRALEFSASRMASGYLSAYSALMATRHSSAASGF